MYFKLTILAITLGIFLISCGGDKFTIEEEVILSHILTLSDDNYMGRMPCTTGEDSTVAYLKKLLKTYGLDPGFGESYTQDVPLSNVESFMSDKMIIETPNSSMELNKIEDFVIHTQRIADSLSLHKSQLVFCGYGIVDEKLGWNDYAGIDMKGKTAVVMINDPGFGGDDPEFFTGDKMTYYGRWTYKYEEADRQGVDGLLIIHETNSAGYPWFVIQSSWTGPQQGISGIDRSDDCGVKGWVSLDKAVELFTNNGLNFTEEIKKARTPGFKPFLLNSTVSASLTAQSTECISQNVMAVKKGNKNPDEIIIYTAHWDHLGTGKSVDGDSIYNGAQDNSTGSSSLLSIAEAFSNQTGSDRSVGFLFVTAEEQGLLGSEYYTLNPSYELDKTVCNINMDGMKTAGAMKDFTVTGIGHSEMDIYAEKAAKSQGRYLNPEPEPQKGMFFRSDHFNFAKKGVPALYAKGEYEHMEKGIEYFKDYNDTYTNERYHAPSDEYNPEIWDLEGVVNDARLYFQIGLDLSSNNDWPTWNSSSEFKRSKNFLKD